MRWFKKPVNLAITIGAAILAVVAIVLTVWGVTHHTEGGILEVCWSGDGLAQYVEGSEDDSGPCEGSEQLRWPQEQIPLTLAPVSSEGQPLAADAPEVRVLGQALSDLNSQVGFELFRLGSALQPSDAEVRFGGAFLGGAGAASPPPGYVAHRHGVSGSYRGHVWIRSDVGAASRLLYLVLQHELLHLAGLAHDDFPASIMYPLTRDEWESGAMTTAHVTDYDRAALRRLYRR